MSTAAGRPDEANIAIAGGRHGTELLRLGYTLSHVVHAYGSMCQAITELATKESEAITGQEFHELNHCLDIAIAGAVSEFQYQKSHHKTKQDVEHLGFLAHELRNALTSVTIPLEMIEKGRVGFAGSTGNVLKKSLKRIGDLIDRSLTEVRLSVAPQINVESTNLLQLVEQIILTADIEAQTKKQTLRMNVDPTLVIEADQQLFYSAISNLIQNALKYTPIGGDIQVRGFFRWGEYYC